MSQGLIMDDAVQNAVRMLTKQHAFDACNSVAMLPAASKCTKDELACYIKGALEQVKKAVVEAVSGGKKRKATGEPKRNVHQKQGWARVPLEEVFCPESFLKPPSTEVINARIKEYIMQTSNQAQQQVVCMACAQEVGRENSCLSSVPDIPNLQLLEPVEPHARHQLTNGVLLYTQVVDKKHWGYICGECERHLQKGKQPPLSLVNRMWVGDIPIQLAVLTLPEQILVARYFPTAYIVKMYPKKKGACFWDKKMMNRGLQGNVSTYRLNPADLGDMVTRSLMPPPAQILAAIIGITFVGPMGAQECTLPQFFRVQRQHVLDMLLWLEANNPLYSDIVVVTTHLAQLPSDGIPEELVAVTKLSKNTALLAQEHASYVPEDGDFNILFYDAVSVSAGAAGRSQLLLPNKHVHR
jgi:hypothetical protein